MRVGLFVEGANHRLARRGDPLVEIWNTRLRSLTGGAAFSNVYGISKAQIAMMKPENAALSGGGENLAQHLARRIGQDGIEAAVVAWDLIPRWNKSAAACRWQETLDIYGGLSAAEGLPDPWRLDAKARLADLEARVTPSARVAVPTLMPSRVLPLCMDRMFEELILNEALLKDALSGGAAVAWPKWKALVASSPPDVVVGQMVEALRKRRPLLPAARHVRGGWVTGKNEWADYILQQALLNSVSKQTLMAHAITKRLVEIGP